MTELLAARVVARVVACVAASIARHFAPGDALLVAYSGGLDSTVLLHVLACALRLPVRACHVHHGLSPHADAWAARCLAQAQQWDVACEVRRVKVPTDAGLGIEGAARRERHRALDEALDQSQTQGGNAWLVLAHHQRDQAETLLANLLRGAGVMGLAAMRERSGHKLRPMLGAARSELERYAHANGLAWIDDESNDDTRYTRNWLRTRVLPALRERFPQADERLAASAAHAGEAQGLLEQLARIDAGTQGLQFPLSISLLRELDAARARNVLRCALALQGLQAPSAARLGEFVRQCREAAPDRHPTLITDAWTLRVKSRQVLLERA